MGGCRDSLAPCVAPSQRHTGIHRILALAGQRRTGSPKPCPISVNKDNNQKQMGAAAPGNGGNQDFAADWAVTGGGCRGGCAGSGECTVCVLSMCLWDTSSALLLGEPTMREVAAMCPSWGRDPRHRAGLQWLGWRVLAEATGDSGS